MRGRKPTPTALKILDGNPSKRPLNKREPRPRVDVPTCPSHLDAVAKTEWARISKQLLTMGLVTHLDRSALAAYCQCYSRWVKAELVLAKEGETYAKDGRIYKHPSLAIASDAMREMKGFLIEFGLSPSSRQRLKTDEQPEDELARFYVG